MQILDVIGALELSANDFQMNLAADVLERRNIKDQKLAIETNREVGERVRKTMVDSGTFPEDLPIEPPIKEVEKRLTQKRPRRALAAPPDRS